MKHNIHLSEALSHLHYKVIKRILNNIITTTETNIVFYFCIKIQSLDSPIQPHSLLYG